MEKSQVFSLVLSVLFLFPTFNGGLMVNAVGAEDGSADGSEAWGYVAVRPIKPICFGGITVVHTGLKIQESHGLSFFGCKADLLSGAGIGNFEEIGPLDVHLKPRNSTWLKIADLLFVDNPVGTGFSYVEDPKLLVKTDYEAACDLTTLLNEFFNKKTNLQKNPLYIVSESYGGKIAVTLGLSALRAIQVGKLKLNLGGIALGASWISPEDSVLSWGPLLKDVTRLDNNGLVKSNRIANEIKQQIKYGKFVEATGSYIKLQGVISNNSNGVDFFNFMLDLWMDDLVASSAGGSDLDTLMNGEIKKKLKIIPKNVKWTGRQYDVFKAFGGDFMKPRILEVDLLLAKGVDVTIYSGQLDVVCSTMGTEAWVSKLKWDGLKTFLAMERTPIYGEGDKVTKGFTKSYRNLHLHEILGAGHFVPADQPLIALNMIASITRN
ncbi:hypothetical protein OROHE_012264 [Orobanche hederae]